MKDKTLVKSSFSATINAPIEKVDIPSWCFTLPESEYQSCSPAHCSAGATTAPDGRRMSINVEILGGSLMVQHYIEEIGQPDHLRLVSSSDVFTPTGRTKIGVIWDLSVKKIDDRTCEFTNMVHSSATPELMDFLGKQGIPWEVFKTARKPISEAHNRQETPLFAKSIELICAEHSPVTLPAGLPFPSSPGRRANLKARFKETAKQAEQLVQPESSLRYPEWQNFYKAALLETDRKALFKQVETAEAAVLVRLQELPPKAGNRDERRQLMDAWSGLQMIKKWKLGFS